MADITMSSQQFDELIATFQSMIHAIEPRRAAPEANVSLEEQTALFAYQWINGHLGRRDVVPPVLHVARRPHGKLELEHTPPPVAKTARIYAEDGGVEEVTIADVTATVLDLTIADDVAIAFVEFVTEHGAPVAIVHRIPAI